VEVDDRSAEPRSPERGVFAGVAEWASCDVQELFQSPLPLALPLPLVAPRLSVLPLALLLPLFVWAAEAAALWLPSPRADVGPAAPWPSPPSEPSDWLVALGAADGFPPVIAAGEVVAFAPPLVF